MCVYDLIYMLPKAVVELNNSAESLFKILEPLCPSGQGHMCMDGCTLECTIASLKQLKHVV